MKTIGIIGGLGPESTVDYYNRIISAFAGTSAGLDYPEIIVYSANLKEMLTFVAQGQWNELSGWLLTKLVRLHRAGADFAAIASNTPHVVFDEIKDRSPLPLLSIVEETRREAQKRDLKHIGLLGTRLTMESAFYQTPFTACGISVSVPTEAEQQLIQQKLFSEIELGIFRDSTRNELLSIVKRMVDQEHIDSVVLGCTELPLILTESCFGIPFLNTSEIHCNSIIRYCLQSG